MNGEIFKHKRILGFYPYYWAVILIAKIKLFFGYKYDKSIIPIGHYCYAPDNEKNMKETGFIYHIIPCEHYVPLGKGWNACKYNGIITDDMVFDDQCKICGERYNDTKND